MLVAIPNYDEPGPSLTRIVLQAAYDAARRNFFSHKQHGGDTAAERCAWAMEHSALQMLMLAALTRLEAESEIDDLLTDEGRAWRLWGIGWTL